MDGPFEFDESNPILLVKHAVRGKCHPERWPAAPKESEGGQAVVNKNFEHKFPDMLTIEAKDAMSPDEFQKQVEMPSYPALLRGFMEDWNCYGSTKNGEVNKLEWTLQKICDRDFVNLVHFQCGVDADGVDVTLNLKEYLELYVNDCNDRNPLLIFDAVVLEHEDCDLIFDVDIPSIFSQDDYLQYIQPLSRPPYQWFVHGVANAGSPIHQDPMGTHAWNALCSGKTLWVLFHPSTPAELLPTKSLDDGDIDDDDLWEDLYSWIHIDLPGIRREVKAYFDSRAAEEEDKNTGGGNEVEWWYREVVQMPGEIVFVPSGWYQASINLEESTAITQNYCSRTNLGKCYSMMADKEVATQWYAAMNMYDREQISRMGCRYC